MMLGPFSAPSSPPDTPTPRKRRPRSFIALSRRWVSRKCELPPSTIVSPSSSSGASSSITASTAGPALTMVMIVRGRSSDWTNSCGRAGAGDRPLGAVLGHELLGLGRGAVVHRDRDVVVGDVAREVGAHHREAGQAESWAAHARHPIHARRGGLVSRGATDRADRRARCGAARGARLGARSGGDRARLAGDGRDERGGLRRRQPLRGRPLRRLRLHQPRAAAARTGPRRSTCATRKPARRRS